MTNKKFTYAICTSQRSGSGLICAYLTKIDNLGKPFEGLNPIYYYKDFSPDDSLEKIIDDVLELRKTANGVAGIKIMYDQLEYLSMVINRRQKLDIHAYDVMKQLAIDKHIFLYRKNKTLQAISRYKAQKTKVWRVFAGQNLSNQNVKFSRFKIKRNIEYFQNEDKKWLQYFKDNNIEPLVICYEDFIEDVHFGLDQILDFLEYKKSDNFVYPPPPIQKQFDSVNEDFYSKMLVKENKLEKISFWMFQKTYSLAKSVFDKYLRKY